MDSRRREGYTSADITGGITTVMRVTRHRQITGVDRGRFDKAGVLKT